MFDHSCISVLCGYFLFFLVFVILLTQIAEKGFLSRVNPLSSDPLPKLVVKVLFAGLLDSVIFAALLSLALCVIAYICGGQICL